VTRRVWKAGLLARALLLALAGVVFFFLAGLFVSWAPDRPREDLRARWAPPPSQFLPIGQLVVHVRDEGPRDDPMPIVLLHGTSDSLHTWDGWTQVLRQQRRVIRFDLPGFGLTGPDPRADYSVAADVRFVLAVLDHLGVVRCVLGGNSLGGQIAWRTALAAPQRVGSLLLVDAGGYRLQPQELPLAFRLARSEPMALVLEKLLPRGVVLSSVRNVYADAAKVTPELVDRYYDMALHAGNRRALMQRFAVVEPDQSARIRELAQPTLVLWGDRDRLIPLQAGTQFARDIAGAKLVVFEGLGHLPHQEDPDGTVIEVLKFLELAPHR